MPAVTWARLAAVLVFAFVVQDALLDQIDVFGAHPDVMVLLPAAAGLVAGAQRGAVVGFLAGLFADLLVQLPFGLSSLTFVLAGFGAGMLVRVPIGRDFPAIETLSCAALGAATLVLYAVIGTITGQHSMLSTETLQTIFVVALGGLVLGHPTLRMVRWCFEGAGPSSLYSVPSGGSALG